MNNLKYWDDEESNELDLGMIETMKIINLLEHERFNSRDKIGYRYLLEDFDEYAERLITAERRNRYV